MSGPAACSCKDPLPSEPVFVPTIEAMADAMRAHHGNCTRDLLQGLGFPLGFQTAHRDEAVALANSRFVCQSVPARRRSLDEILATIPHEARFVIDGVERVRVIPEEDRLAAARLEMLQEDDAERAARLAEREAHAAQIIHEHMPGTIYVVAELQARGFSISEIDHVLPRARARAALAYARGGAH